MRCFQDTLNNRIQSHISSQSHKRNSLQRTTNRLNMIPEKCHKILCATLTLAITFNIELLFANVDASSPDQTNKYLIGVQPDRRDFYQISNEQIFKCIDGSMSIPMNFVNDDYCDCRDASDEPGTSACPHGRFFCPNEGYIQRLISSAWVNDGLCDCCDGSDEYNSNATCQNTCGVLGEMYRLELEKNREIADQGSAIRSQYKEQARQRKEQNTQLLDQYKRELNEKESAIKKLEEELNSDFGPAHVFFPLKGKCFSFNDREYTYTLCPFERATQESTSGMQTELGRWSGWAGQDGNVYSAQKYEGGIQCWNGPARSVLVNIECGVEDRITAVTEPAKCEYVYNFITPAACPDLDPPEPELNQENNEQQVTTQDPSLVVPSQETEDDSSELLNHPNYYPDEHNEAPDDHGSSQEGGTHDEL